MLLFRLVQHYLVPGFQMHFHRPHLFGDILACPLNHALTQIRSELRPGIGRDIDTAP